MSQIKQLCVYNSVAEASLLEPLRSLPGFDVLREATTWAELEAWLAGSSGDLVLINLDAPDGLQIVERVSQTSPDSKIIGICEMADSRLLIQANRAGCSQFIASPLDAEEVQQVIEQNCSPGHTALSAHKIICVVGASGGAGTTTIACNLSIELAKLTDSRCALIDLNLELGSVGFAFDTKPDYTLADLCAHGVEIDHQLLEASFQKLPNNVFLLHGPHKAASVDAITPEAVKTILTLAGEIFPFVVVDLPRTFNTLNATAVTCADHVLIVTELAVTGIYNATRLHRRFLQMGVSDESIGVVVNRHSGKRGLIAPKMVMDQFGKECFGVVPNDYRRVQAALDLGEPLAAKNQNSPIRAAIRQMATKLAGDPVAGDGAVSSVGDTRPASAASGADVNRPATESDSQSVTKHLMNAARRLAKWSGQPQIQPDDTVSQSNIELQKQRTTVETGLHELQCQIDVLSQESAARAQEVTQLTSDLEGTRNELAAKQQGCRDLEAELAAVAAERDTALNQQFRSKAELQAAREQVEQLHAPDADSQQQEEAQQAQIGALRKQLDIVQGQLSRSEARNVRLQEQFQERQARTTELSQELELFRNEQARAAEGLACSSGQLQETEAQVERLQDQVADLCGLLTTSPKKDADPRPISRENFQNLLDVSEPKWRAVFTLALNCALYPSELGAVKRSEARLDAKTLIIERGKNGLPRFAVLWDRTIRTIREYQEAEPHDSEYLFVNAKGTPYDAMQIGRKFRRICNKAGLPREITFAMIRDGSFSAALEGGADPSEARLLAGHPESLADHDLKCSPGMVAKACAAIEEHYFASSTDHGSWSCSTAAGGI